MTELEFLQKLVEQIEWIQKDLYEENVKFSRLTYLKLTIQSRIEELNNEK